MNNIIEAEVYKSLRAKTAMKAYEEHQEKQAMLRREKELVALLLEANKTKAALQLTTGCLVLLDLLAVAYIVLNIFN